MLRASHNRKGCVQMPCRKFALPAVLAALVLELLPISAVLCSARPSGGGTPGWFRQTFSYFSLFPVNYGNLFPLLTGVCTLLLAGLLLTARRCPRLYPPGKLLATLTTILSLFPFFMGARYLSLPGIGISALLFCGTFCAWCRR